jgi:hypothetical protein
MGKSCNTHGRDDKRGNPEGKRPPESLRQRQ